ncbi:hypothetical protein Pcac1_g20980 [Phytophthora cactorum]|nr:hypothetical protein Pcac1_g20980 [Phytophthora cactorum]
MLVLSETPEFRSLSTSNMLSVSSTLVVSSNAMVNAGVLGARAVLLLVETPWALTLESDVAAAEMSGLLTLGRALLFALPLLIEVIAELAGIAKRLGGVSVLGGGGGAV